MAHEPNTPEISFTGLEQQTQIRAIQCGEIGPFNQVIAGLDIALWDMAARRAGLPLRCFINDGATNQVPAYASGIQIAAANEILPRARTQGHRTFKLKVGFDMATDIATVCAIQAGLSASEAIACDANQAWSLNQAQRFVAGIAGVPLQWLEEPLPVFTQTAQWQSLAQDCPIPLAGGENLSGNADFDEAINLGHLSVIQPDVAKWGRNYGMPRRGKKLHCEQGAIISRIFLVLASGLAASAELLAAVGGDGLLEVDVNDNPLRSLFFDGTEPVTKGKWICNDSIGLGIETLPDALDQYQTLYAEMR